MTEHRLSLAVSIRAISVHLQLLGDHLVSPDGSEVNGIRMCTVSGSPDQVE